MKIANLVILAAVVAAMSFAANAAPSTTDEARADAAKRVAAADHAASLRAFVPLDSESVIVSDTDSARRASAQLNARRTHDKYLADVLSFGSGIRPAAITATDTDSARAAAGQERREYALRADFASLVAMSKKREADSIGSWRPDLVPAVQGGHRQPTHRSPLVSDLASSPTRND